MHSAWMLGGDDEGSELLTPQPAGTGRCTRSSHSKGSVCRSSFPPNPPPHWPFQQSAKPKISGHIFSMSVCWGWGLLSKSRVMTERNSPLGTCTQQPRSTLWPWGPLSFHASLWVQFITPQHCPAATGHTAWTKQDRRLILLSLLDFNWKGICLWLNFLSCLSQSLVDQKKCKLKENILDVPGFKVEHG